MSITRRTFLLSIGAMGATPLLGAQQRPLKLSAIRGGACDQTLKLTPIELNVGAKRAFTALHVSDTHLNFWDVTDHYGNEERERYFGKRWVRFPYAMTSFCATLDYAERKKLPILHTGDLIDWNTVGNLTVVRRLLKGTEIHYALGNHEYQTSDGAEPAASPEQARARVRAVIGNDLTVASRVMNGVNFVAFDNGETNLRAETITGLRHEFEKGLPVVLMCHIPPKNPEHFRRLWAETRRRVLAGSGGTPEEIAAIRPSSVDIWDTYDEKTKAFYRWLEQQKSLKAILCGHWHTEERGAFSEYADMIVAGANHEGMGYKITFV